MRILVLFAHPRYSGSQVQRAMLQAISGLDGVTVHDLYAAYPDFSIDVAFEQNLLLRHDLIVFQHPLYWYSSPAILKEWQDLVLELNWAYGPSGSQLHGKFLLNAVSAGGAESAYRESGRNRFAVRELLSPFNQTAHLCGMAWLDPFVLHEGRRHTAEALAQASEGYRDLMTGLRDRRIDPFKHLAPGYRLPGNFAARVA